MRFSSLILSLTLGVFSCGAAAAPVNLEVLDATIKDRRIDGAEVMLQKNGEQTVSGSTDAQGRVQLSPRFDADDNSLLIIKKPGYSNLVVKCPCDGMTYAISPVMKDLDGMRIVLTWGKDPSDLDSHLVYPQNHVYFDHKQGVGAELDVDDIDSYGPETITLNKKQFGDSYIYAVQDFTHHKDAQNDGLSNSQAKVFVYVGQSLVRTYYVPQGQRGNLWTVFRLNPNGDFEDINTVSGIVLNSPGDVAERLQPMLTAGNSQAQAQTQSSTMSSGVAKELNRRGETAYHQGDLDSAIALYQQAIEQDGNFGQAYSNLGLAYQKQNNIAESIWANRKAIALASGDSAATVRASSYYNIARIYEKAGQYQDALQHYRLAKQQKANPVYDKAIERVQELR